jgi:hypothetical protein
MRKEEIFSLGIIVGGLLGIIAMSKHLPIV